MFGDYMFLAVQTFTKLDIVIREIIYFQKVEANENQIKNMT